MIRLGVRCVTAITAVMSLGFSTIVHSQIPMPDPSEMSGLPLPSSDLPNASVSVRLIRSQLSNNITDHPVELHSDEVVFTVSTDEFGRALFEDLEAGSSVSVSAQVGDEMLVSRSFAVPALGGVRVMLVAEPSIPPVATTMPGNPGLISLGGDTRWVVEMADEAVEVYYLLEAVNTADAPVVPTVPVVFDLPFGAQGAVLLEGTTSQAQLDGGRVSVVGSFQPGRTRVNVAYVLPYTGSDLVIEQTMPVAVDQIAIVAEKYGDMQMRSPQITQSREMNARAGTFMVGGGPRLAANETFSISLFGLPHHSLIPLRVALMLVGLFVVWCLWQSTRPMGAKNDPPLRQKLEARRDRLYDDLVRVETTHRIGTLGDGPYTLQRKTIFGQLERLYQRLEPNALEMPRGRAGLPG